MKSPAGVRGPPRANQRWPGGQSHSNCPGWGQDYCSGIGSYKKKPKWQPSQSRGVQERIAEPNKYDDIVSMLECNSDGLWKMYWGI